MLHAGRKREGFMNQRYIALFNTIRDIGFEFKYLLPLTVLEPNSEFNTSGIHKMMYNGAAPPARPIDQLAVRLSAVLDEAFELTSNNPAMITAVLSLPFSILLFLCLPFLPCSFFSRSYCGQSTCLVLFFRC
jgi:hypothetical protein